eukprot:9782226-Karenia_brevis.AAC.1
MPRATLSRKQRKTIDNGLSVVDSLDKTLSAVLRAEGFSSCGEPVPAAEPRSQGFKVLSCGQDVTELANG